MLTKKGERMQKMLNERDAVASLDWGWCKTHIVDENINTTYRT